MPFLGGGLRGPKGDTGATGESGTTTIAQVDDLMSRSFYRDFATLKNLNDHGTGPAITFTRASGATYFDVNGVLQTAGNDVARFDHDPATGASRGLLIEEARTNLLERSAEFDNAYWTKVNSTITANSITAPDGAQSADLLVENTATDYHLVRRSVAASAEMTYTASVFVKGHTRTLLSFQMFGNSGNSGLIFNTQTQGVSSVGGTGGFSEVTAAVSDAGNGWYRLSLTTKTNSGLTTLTVQIALRNSSNNDSYTGDGTSGLYIWGAQLEAGAFPTSYIPTTTAAATRSADSAVVTPVSSFYNQSEGTMFCESASSALVAADNQGIWGVGDNTLSFQSANTLYATYVSQRIVANSFLSGASQLSSLNNTSVAQSANTFARSALVYKLDDYAISTNGSSVATDTSSAVPPMPTGLSIGSLDRAWASSYVHINGWIKKFAYYPKRLTNTLLQNLTA